MKTVDVTNFPETTLSALIMDIEPGAMRELHWHPDADEWQYYLEGQARMTVFDATSKARTFNYAAGTSDLSREPWATTSRTSE